MTFDEVCFYNYRNPSTTSHSAQNQSENSNKTRTRALGNQVIRKGHMCIQNLGIMKGEFILSAARKFPQLRMLRPVPTSTPYERAILLYLVYLFWLCWNAFTDICIVKPKCFKTRKDLLVPFNRYLNIVDNQIQINVCVCPTFEMQNALRGVGRVKGLV